MDGERDNCASRRALITGAPALAVIAAVAAETGMSIASVADPYVSLAPDYFTLRSAIDTAGSDVEADELFARWIDNDDKLTATRATTMAGALAGLRVAHAEFLEFFAGSTPGGKMVAALIQSAIAVLDREVARV